MPSPNNYYELHPRKIQKNVMFYIRASDGNMIKYVCTGIDIEMGGNFYIHCKELTSGLEEVLSTRDGLDFFTTDPNF